MESITAQSTGEATAGMMRLPRKSIQAEYLGGCMLVLRTFDLCLGNLTRLDDAG
jgi:hypothetical protein